jgi:hypothetical protein
MTNQEIISIVRKARLVKPYARVHFPYSVEHVERILGITFNDEDRSDIQRFYDTAEFFAQNCDINNDKPIYTVVYQMSEKSDFLTIQEAKVLLNSLHRTTRDDADMYDLLAFAFAKDNPLWIYTPDYEYYFDVDINKVRRMVNIANFFGEDIEYVDLQPNEKYEHYGAYKNLTKYY